MFSNKQNSEQLAILALATICQRSLANLNARAWMASRRCRELQESIDRQIEFNKLDRSSALWFMMSDSYAQQQMQNRR